MDSSLHNQSSSRFFAYTLCICFYTLIGVIAISSDSLWIDEFMTHKFASLPSINGMFECIFEEKGSEAQMPFYVSYMWLYEKLFSIGEFSLRASALPFFITGMTALTIQLSRHLKSHLSAYVVFGLSPFIWYYLNEARPYSIHIGISALILAALLQLSGTTTKDSITANTQRSYKNWFRVFCAAVLLLSGMSMLCQLWVGAAILCTLVVIPKERLIGIFRDQKIALVFTFAGLLCIGFYYLWSLTIGARAAATDSPGLFSTIFIFYELMGLTGTGPGRFELREHGVSVIQPYLTQLIIHGLLIGSVFTVGIFKLFRSRNVKSTLAVVVCLSLPALLILAAGIITEFRVLGRHFAPLVIILLYVLCIGFHHMMQHRNKFGIILLILFTLFQAESCLLVRYGDRHKKDNYKLAATIANQALSRGETVWWNANSESAPYYKLPTVNSGPNHRFYIIECPTDEEIKKANTPDIVITSKADIFDINQVMSQYLQSRGYIDKQKIRCFTIWEKPTTP